MFFEIFLKVKKIVCIWKKIDYNSAFEVLIIHCNCQNRHVSLVIPIFNYFLGIMSTNEVGINYLKSTNFMFLGGLILAMAVEQSGLHQRVALKIMMMIGTNPRNLLLGFMLTTGKK